MDLICLAKTCRPVIWMTNATSRLSEDTQTPHFRCHTEHLFERHGAQERYRQDHD